MLRFDPEAGLLESGFQQPSRPNNFSVPNGLFAYWGFDTEYIDFTNNLALNLAGEDRSTAVATTQYVAPSSGSNTAGYTIVSQTPLPAGMVINSVGVYRTTPQTFNIKIVQVVYQSSTVVVSETLSHGGTGWEDHTLSSPYTVPLTGVYGIGVYSAATMGECGTSARLYIAGDATGTQTWTFESGPVQGLRYSGIPYLASKNGILNNFTSASLVDGRIGQALKFNGSSSYVDITGSYPLSFPEQSLSFWLPDKGTNKTCYLFSRSTVYAYPPNFGLLYNGGNFTITQGGEVLICTWASITNGDHICIVMLNPGWIAYKNGVLINSSGTSLAWNGDATSATSIGRLGNQNDFYFDGVMDDVRVYSRALDQGEVIELHKAGLAGRRNSVNNFSLELPVLWSPPTDHYWQLYVSKNSGTYQPIGGTTGVLPADASSDADGTTILIPRL